LCQERQPNTTQRLPRLILASAGDAFANHGDVIGGKMMSFYGLKVNGNTFAMFGRKNISSPNFLDPTSMPFVREGVGKNFDLG
jgi:hypothetical protein